MTFGNTIPDQGTKRTVVSCTQAGIHRLEQQRRMSARCPLPLRWRPRRRSEITCEPCGAPRAKVVRTAAPVASLSTYEPCGPKRTYLPVAAIDNISDDAASKLVLSLKSSALNRLGQRQAFFRHRQFWPTVCLRRHAVRLPRSRPDHQPFRLLGCLSRAVVKVSVRLFLLYSGHDCFAA